MPRQARSIQRPRVPRKERSRLLLVTEGEVTEVQYFQGMAQFLRASGASVRGVRTRGIGRDPLRVVRTACAEAEGEDFDEVWAVVDVDDHASLEEALREGAQRGVPVAVSNPCFEV